ncbi:MAG: Ig-like domain-containing protein [Planctomycetes bacterium]|nr:Ig-like domain-containing protein [Planctomycetota bacterium]
MSFSKRKKFTTSAIGSCSGSYDIQALQAQEIGHSLGLGHSANGAAIMFGSIGKCVFKIMHSDDHNGINTIYNPGFSGGGGCTATEALLVGHSCAAPRRGRNCLTITIDVNDDCGNPVAGASVTVQLEGDGGEVLTGTANTDSSGSITFALRCKDVESQTYISTVLSIEGSLDWDPNDPDNTAAVEIIVCEAR